MPKPLPNYLHHRSTLSTAPVALGPSILNRGSSGKLISIRHDVRRILDFFRRFFATWLKVDLESLKTAITVGNTMMKLGNVVTDLATTLCSACMELFTASVFIKAHDDLNRDIQLWIGANVLDARSPTSLVASTGDVGTFETLRFKHDRNTFIVRRIRCREDELREANEELMTGTESLVIMVFGWSTDPIRRFLETVRDFADERRKAKISVRVSKVLGNDPRWEGAIQRPMRRLETVHFDETTKAELVADMELYLDPSTRHYYTIRGIPYRRGYLFYGPPGTGKTSLCLALATHFCLELYLLHIPSLSDDSQLEILFKALPSKCIVLLEDIDAVGVQRKSEIDEMEEEERKKKTEKKKGTGSITCNAHDEEQEKRSSRVTLSGLLNVLDGVISREGRIVIMTSNFANKLDKALTRPGRIDRQVFLGSMSPDCAKWLFIRMFSSDSDATPLTSLLDTEHLDKLATEFSTYIPKDTFTPAQLQEFLISHRHSAANAVKETKSWVADQQRLRTEEEERAKRLAIWKAAKKAEKENAEAQKPDDEMTKSTDDIQTSLVEQITTGLGNPGAPSSAGGEAKEADAASNSAASEVWSPASESFI
ncbi:hypothetical protein ONS96_002070 [Cadophora gregata f. sp. sojae]|nr:hypothetical protein ONS96_002070 [Cadophora gregata f. sp. sojae]